ncbi:MAG: hypothetical protein KZQ88_18075 [Candidatus Thiodiazotropha sp. (ex Dulcina madagascariensis)]|nr:hypothetical protein [Candidatus Thiodiazotropha sp. (ex Dulcina madagascariensis)]MCU7928305.1 hypothetical protein [Candidatus Thiodiazotropha sp. (ex Dulcina madagascariensis)]
MKKNLIFEIDSAIIAQTDKCKVCHRCLTDRSFQLCKIDYLAADGAVLFVSGEQCINCDYRVSFGGGSVCSCPVRKEIVKKYKL